jgi:hypothetical protein
MPNKESPAQQRKVKKVMHEYKHGELKGGKGKHPKVKSRRQAVAIALSEAKVPPRKGDTRAKKSAAKKSTAKSSPRKTTRTKATAAKRKTATKRKPVARRAGARKTTTRKSRRT